MGQEDGGEDRRTLKRGKDRRGSREEQFGFGTRGLCAPNDQSAETICSLIGDYPVIPSVSFIRCSVTVSDTSDRVTIALLLYIRGYE